MLQNPTEGNKTVRHAIITRETGEYGWGRALDYIGVPCEDEFIEYEQLSILDCGG